MCYLSGTPGDMPDDGTLRGAYLPASAAICDQEQGRREKEVGRDMILAIDPGPKESAYVFLKTHIFFIIRNYV